MSSLDWKKPKIDNSQEKIATFKEKLEASRKYVEELLMGKKNGEPKIVSDLDAKRQETAENILKLQKENGRVFKKEMESNDISRVREIQKKLNCNFEEAMQTLVENCVYQSIERQFAENYVVIIKDVERIINEYGNKLTVFPMNALSKDSLSKLEGIRAGLSTSIKLKMILDTFVPGLMELDIVSNDYSVIAKKYYALSKDELRSLAEDIKKNFGNENGNIDNIFAEKNSKGLAKLLEALRRNNLTFDQFAVRFGLNYTRCFNIPSLPAVKQMVDDYYFRYGTYRYINNNDQYLSRKLASVREQENIFSNEQMFENWGLDTSKMVTPHNLISDYDARQKQDKLIMILEDIYPDRIVKEDFVRNHKNTYRLICQLAKRFRFPDVNSYLKSLGFSREISKYNGNYKNTVCLTERDLIFYKFFGSVDSPEQIEKAMNDFCIVLAPVEDYAGFYTKLAYGKLDALHYYSINAKKFGDY